MMRDVERAGIETPAEACAALAILMAGADGMGTMEEGRFITQRARTLPLFADLDETQFSHLLSDVTGEVWPSLAAQGGGFDEEALEGLIRRIRDLLPDDLRQDALRMASDLAWVDGYSTTEHVLLERLRAGLQGGRA